MMGLLMPAVPEGAGGRPPRQDARPMKHTRRALHAYTRRTATFPRATTTGRPSASRRATWGAAPGGVHTTTWSRARFTARGIFGPEPGPGPCRGRGPEQIRVQQPHQRRCSSNVINPSYQLPLVGRCRCFAEKRTFINDRAKTRHRGTSENTAAPRPRRAYGRPPTSVPGWRGQDRANHPGTPRPATTPRGTARLLQWARNIGAGGSLLVKRHGQSAMLRDGTRTSGSLGAEDWIHDLTAKGTPERGRPHGRHVRHHDRKTPRSPPG